MLSLGAASVASAAGTSVAAPASFPAGIEVIVVTAKRAPVADVQPIYEVIVTAKRPTTTTTAQRTPPAPATATAIEMPKVELAIADNVVRL
jgi:hypothetical protein